MFDSGSAELKGEIATVLDQIIEIIKLEDDIVQVWGHTDNLPINTARFRNNWDLSIARAQSVIEYIHDRAPAIDPANLRAVGAGDEHPIASNDTPEGRAQNRRVELFINYKE
jgi:chemotaxis protein MotB